MAVKSKQAHAPPPKPQFFKILLPCFSQRLRIPERFNKCVVGEMPKKATILSPLGGPWIVEVFSDNNFLNFGEGWQEFSQAHDLDVGYLLLFTYEGDMVFTVTVFDRTTCMKDYVPAGEGNKVDVSSYCNVVVKPCGRPRPEDALRERSLSEILGSMDAQKHNAKLAWACREGSRFGINISSCNPCEEPSLLLPPQFLKYSSGKKGTLATIFSPNGKAWHVRVHEDGKGFHFADGWQRFAEAHNLRRGDSLVFKHNGDLLFDVTIFDNGIGEGECNLEVANSRMPTKAETSEKGLEELPMPLYGNRVANAMEHINAQDGSVKMEQSAEDGLNEKAPDIANGSVRILHFELVINFSTPYRRHAFDLPAKFIASNGLRRIKQLFLRDPNGLLWPVRISHRRGQQCCSTGCAGWRDFCIGNNVRNGDVCLFQLEGKNELHVKIHRRKHQKAMMVSRGLGQPRVPLSRERAAKAGEPIIEQQGLVKMEEAHDGDVKTPNMVDGSGRKSHFEAVIDFSLPYRRYAIGIPTKFMASNGLSHIKQLLLRDPNGQLWPLRISSRRTHRRFTGYAGWHDFCIGNNLQDGDVCLFQLKGKAELHVQIHRRRHQKSMKDLSSDFNMKSDRLLPRQSAAGLRKSERYHHQVQQFTCTISRSYYCKGQLHIPSAFVSSLDLSSTHQVTLLDKKARLWPVKLFHWKAGMSSRATIACGWKAFCIANTVKVGDKCVFKLASKVKNDVFHISIIKKKAVDPKQISGS